MAPPERLKLCGSRLISRAEATSSYGSTTRLMGEVARNGSFRSALSIVTLPRRSSDWPHSAIHRAPKISSCLFAVLSYHAR